MVLLSGLRRYSTGAGRAKMLGVLREELEAIKAAGTWKTERIITSPQSHKISVQARDKPVINMCANNYLGLADNPEVIAAAKHAMDTHGSGLASVRFICGTQDIHKGLESRIAKFHQMEDAILFPSCFDANAAIFEVLLTPEDAVFSDELNHASIIDGIRLCKAQKNRFKHRDMGDLEEKLRSSDARLKLIVSDGVFSMDGTICHLKEMCDLAEEYEAVVLIDECHATGFFGKTGRGTPEYFDVMDRVDLINSTMGKALGGAMGGYTTGPQEVIDLLRNKARPYLFSNTLPPAVVGATTKVFDMLLESSDLVEKVQSNTQLFRTKMADAGFTVGGDPEHPICPIMLGEARLAAQFADDMLERGVFVIGFSYPVVPKGKARIRVQISAAHTEEEILHTVDAFTQVAKARGVL
ncbi:glycine C-acetyltransferase [Salpingoeca rosetta]|uniref:2-amino-3-ketobutyrate coenzyme A ligase, mitochondrial n=1 Tax=Salpingoeca rosetta (strain ATCC 50818 / BSB-021) TaxID=946362 RepID=F2UHA8_SALR5|nr:glycine C-acetyltransferase [Salpingoeca rosetta]EGD76507.1 glycine C-acetyltransferase [Salpingoeca rosetta]|eukprot:XP_004991421.1 glycine C-acetyltransferase [Salpingoeca rosetta]